MRFVATRIHRLSAEEISELMDILTCDECHLLIDGEYANFNGRSYHKDCFVCQFCQKPLSSQFTSHDGKYYHSEVCSELGAES